MDLIAGPPETPENDDSIVTIVCRLTKMAGHFIPSTTSTTSEKLAQLLIWEIDRLRGVLRAIVSDRDPSFTSEV